MDKTFDVEKTIIEIKPILEELWVDSTSVGRGQLISLNKIQLSIIEELQGQICVLLEQSNKYSKLKEEFEFNLKIKEKILEELIETKSIRNSLVIEKKNLQKSYDELLSETSLLDLEKSKIENNLIELEKDYLNLLELVP